MGTAWIGFAGVALGAVLGLLPRFWDRRDAREQLAAERERAAMEAAAMAEAQQNGVLMKVARSTNEFLAAWAHVDSGGPAAQQTALDRSADMLSTWTEALVVVGDDARRRVIDTTLREATRHAGRASELPAMAQVAERGLTQLLGLDPVP